MNQDKSGNQPKSRKAPPGKTPPPPSAPVKVPPLFRPVDWLAFAITALLVFIGYYLTLAPDLTLEDSGELAVGSFYAGVPHPPGYPVWTLYTWLFTVIFPFANVAWRVALSSAVAGAVACGLLGLVVSRGNSMMIEGIAMLKSIDRQRENALCVVTGTVAGLLMGFNGYMWSQAVIVEVYTLSMVSLMAVLCLLLRWAYAPGQRRYLYFAFFFFGICLTNHMSLLVAAMGIEVAVMAVQPRLGRDLFLGNVIVYVIASILVVQKVITNFENNLPLYFFFNAIGVGSIIACVWLMIKTGKLGTEWKAVLISGLMWLLGAAFYLYMPIASMTNPPMNWGYPRTPDGFKHALMRGQYESVHPTSSPIRLFTQILQYADGAREEFNLVYLVIGLIPFVFYRFMQRRERAWLVGLSGVFLCLSLLLLILLNPGSDKQSVDLNRVFFTASHVIVAIAIGYGLGLIGAFFVTHYEQPGVRRWFLYGAAAAVALGVYTVADVVHNVFYDQTAKGGIGLLVHGLQKTLREGQNKLPVYAALFLFALTVAFFLVIVLGRKKPQFALALGLFALMPVHSIIGHWFENEQRNHLFGYWFGHDMFTPPFNVYPEMTKDSILFGGTDPGRFCPTYMIFCESFIPPSKRRDPKFDRRDVYIITQNALADLTYLNYIRAHYNRSTQDDPPFFQTFFHTKVLAFVDKIFMSLGQKIEDRRRREGVYPPKEIKTPSIEDSQVSFNEYYADAQRRTSLGQLKPGEDVKNEDGRLQISGQVAVMAINGLLTKIIFEKNPDHEFFVEESFPLDWMYPYLSPFGIIMKINRQALPELTQEMIDKDHQFWSLYSQRLVGNWITYDTPVTNICAMAEKLYLRHDFRGFTGDRKFIRDDNGQKAFSKLRSSIGGIYAWRVGNAKAPPEQQRMIKEAEFAFKQAFAFCPFSPEAVYRYVNLLLSMGRVDDAIAIARTCQKLDRFNAAIKDLVMQLENMKEQRNIGANLGGSLAEVSALLQRKQTGEAMRLMDQIVANPQSDPNSLVNVARRYAELGNATGLEQTLVRLVQLVPENPDVWYDLAAIQAVLGKRQTALPSLKQAMQLNTQRLARDPKAKDLAAEAARDDRFGPLRQSPEFQQIVPAR